MVIGSRIRHRAFSIVEMVVSLGVIMVLAGLILPAISSARATGKINAQVSHIRQIATLVSGYANDQRDRYPAHGRHASDGMLQWYRPMIATGHFGQVEDVDPEGLVVCNDVTFALSGCLVSEPALFQRGHTLPIDLTPLRGASQSDVSFPSDKGLMVKWLHIMNGEHVFWTYEPWIRPLGPVAMADGSAAAARCTDFVSVEDAYLEHWVGHPVLSTWGGFHGRDR